MATPRTTRSRTALTRASPRSTNILQPTSAKKLTNKTNKVVLVQENIDDTNDHNQDDDNDSIQTNHSDSYHINKHSQPHPKPHIAVTPAKRRRITPNDSINHITARPIIAREGHAVLSLHSFLPDSVVQLGILDPQNSSNARVDPLGYGLFALKDKCVIWKVSDSSDTSVTPKQILIDDNSTVTVDCICLIEHPDDNPSIIYVTRSGAVYFTKWNEQPSVMSQMSLTRDDYITCVSCVRDSIFLVGTAQGRLTALFLDNRQSISRISAVDITKKTHGMLSGLVSATGRMLRWSSGNTQTYAQSTSPVLAIIPYFIDDQDFGAYVLHQDTLAQWRVMGAERTLLWSTAFNRVLDGQREVRAISMTSMQNRLAVLFSVQNEVAEFFRIAVFDVSSDSTPPIDRYSRIISLPSRSSCPLRVAASDGDQAKLFVWSLQDVWVTQIPTNDDDIETVSAYSFNTCTVEGGGLIGELNHEAGTVPSYRHAECVLVSVKTGIIDVRCSSGGRDDSESLATSMDMVSLDSVSSDNVLKAAFFFFQQNQQSTSRLKLEHASSTRVMPSLTEPSPALDLAITSFARQILDAPVTHVQENDAVQLKMDNFESFLSFLHFHKLDDVLSPRAQTTLLMYGEFAAISSGLLSLIQSTERALDKSTTDRKAALQRQKILDAVVEHCCRRLSSTSQPFSYDRFFSHLTVIHHIFDGCSSIQQHCQRVDQASSIKQQEDCCYSLQAITSILDVVFTESARYRELHPSQNSQASQQPTRWTVSADVQSCVRFHCDLLKSTLSHIKNLASSFNAMRIDLFAGYLRLARLFLLELHDAFTSHPDDVQLLNQFSSLRSTFIHDLRRLLPVDLGSQSDVIVDFAAEFRDYESLIDISISEPALKLDDASPQLEYLSTCAHRFGKQFAEVLFHVAVQQQRPSLLFLLPSPPEEYGQWLSEFLQDKPDLSWISDINGQRFAAASSSLLAFVDTQNAAELSMTWSHQKVLLSISKLSLLCDLDSKSNLDLMTSLDDGLDVCDAQAYAAQGQDSTLLSPLELIDRLLELAVAPTDASAFYSTDAERLETDNDPFFHALDVFHKALYPLRLTSNEEDAHKYSVLSTIWSAVVQVDYPLLVNSIKETSSGRSDVDVSLPAELEERTKLYAVWTYLRDVDFYNRRPEFEISFKLFVDKESWLEEEDRAICELLKKSMKHIQKSACRPVQ